MFDLHRSAADYAYDRLREELLAGHLGPGSPIVEGEWAERLGLSVTPVREALRRLEAQGLVVRRRHRDVRVRSFTEAEAEALYEYRAMLEAMCAGLAAARIDAAGAERLRGLVRAMKEALRSGTPIELHNNAFHAALGEMSGNPFLAYALHDVWLMVPVLRAASWSRFHDRPSEAVEEHCAIAEAVAAGRAAEATDLARTHALRAWQRLFEALDHRANDMGASQLEERWRVLEELLHRDPPAASIEGADPGSLAP